MSFPRLNIVALLTFVVALSGGTLLALQTTPTQEKPKTDRGALDELAERLRKKQAESQPKRAGTPTTKPAAPRQVDKTNADSYYAHLQDLLKVIPDDVRKSKLKTADLHTAVDRVFVGLTEFLTRFPTDSRRAEVLYHNARLISMNQARVVFQKSAEYRESLKRNLTPDELRLIRREYLKGATAAADEALTLTDDPTLRLKLEKVRGQIFYFGDYLQEAIDQYTKILREFPNDDKPAETQTALIGSFEKARQFDNGVLACDDFIAKHLRTEYAPHVLSYKGKMLLYVGRLEEAAAHYEKYRSFMTDAFAGKKMESLGGFVYPLDIRKSFSTYIDRLDFQVGFALYALGDVPGAAAAFQRCIDHLQSKATEGTIDQVGQVFMGRAQRLNNTLAALQGRPAPAFDFSQYWINTSFDLAGEKGNVVTLFFNPYENNRSAAFSTAIQAFYKDRFNDGFRAAWLALPKGSKNWDDQTQRLEANMNALGVTYPTTLARDEAWPPTVYEDYNIAAGTPTLVLVDRAGNIAWYKMDPTFRDFAVAGRVAERLMSQPKP